MRICMIGASASNAVIGNHGTLPWHLPNDLKHFKALTLGHIIVMGRKTFESFKAPLPNRTHWVLSQDASFQPCSETVVVFSSVEEVLQEAQNLNLETLFIIGGASIYKQFEPYVTTIYWTHIHATLEGDTFYEFDRSQYVCVEQNDSLADARHAFNYTLCYSP